MKLFGSILTLVTLTCSIPAYAMGQKTVFLITDFWNDEMPSFKVTTSKDPHILKENHLEGDIYIDPSIKAKRGLFSSILKREFRPTVLTKEEASKLFLEIQSPEDPLLKIIDWTVKGGGCSHRVRQLSRWLRSKEISHEDVYLAGAQGSLRVKNEPSIGWPYHNAIVLTVSDNIGTPQKMVVDLTLHPQGLIQVGNWVNLMESEVPSVHPIEFHYPGIINGYAQNEKILSIRPSEFDSYWDESAIMLMDRKQCIEQDLPKLLQLEQIH